MQAQEQFVHRVWVPGLRSKNILRPNLRRQVKFGLKSSLRPNLGLSTFAQQYT